MSLYMATQFGKPAVYLCSKTCPSSWCDKGTRPSPCTPEPKGFDSAFKRGSSPLHSRTSARTCVPIGPCVKPRTEPITRPRRLTVLPP